MLDGSWQDSDDDDDDSDSGSDDKCDNSDRSDGYNDYHDDDYFVADGDCDDGDIQNDYSHRQLVTAATMMIL